MNDEANVSLSITMPGFQFAKGGGKMMRSDEGGLLIAHFHEGDLKRLLFV